MNKIIFSHFKVLTKTIFVLTVIIVNISACRNRGLVNRFSDSKLQKLFTFQYNRQSDSLYPYFTHSNPVYRKEAALSFSSIGDTNAIERIIPLLQDVNAEVRKAAAFSIGQFKNKKTLSALINQSKIEKESEVNQFLLEAIGRSATPLALKYLIDFIPKDTIEEAGVAWGIYRAANRGVVSDSGTLKLAKNLGLEKAFEVSLASTFYFYRTKSTIDAQLNELMQLAGNSKYIEVRIAATRALRKTKNTQAVEFLIKTMIAAKDYRLRVDAINTLRAFPYDYSKTKILDALHNDKEVSVKVAAAEYFESAKNATDFDLYLSEAAKSNNWRIRTILLNAAMKTEVDKEKVSNILKNNYSRATEVSEKQILLSALAESNNNLDFILSAFKKESYGEILATFSETLMNLKSSKDFKVEDEQKLATFFVDLLSTNNKFLISQGLIGIVTPEFQVKKYFPNPQYLETAKQKAKPIFKDKDMSYLLFDLAKTYYEATDSESIKLFSKKAFDLSGYSTNAFKPIDWKSISAIPENLKVLVKTVKGNFTMQLLVNETPFTVKAFLDGVNNKLFDSLQFYRVIPNFVNQTGGTTDLRKDSLANLRIRSEYNMTRHREGTVNLASNGRDTETTHFSIMLCPTPWNDNNYTIFGKVVEGMNVVHKIELSDYIISMNVIK
jgi:cyclophilin family peptidyl-prolyl cis-trans isomerase